LGKETKQQNERTWGVIQAGPNPGPVAATYPVAS
jgi:hypothetical protein